MVRLALVGTGRMAAIHFRNIARHPLATCPCVISNSLSRAQQFTREHAAYCAAEACADLTSARNSDSIDGVVIASASSQHFEQVKQCLSQQKPVFVEKPIASSLSEIDELYATAKERNVPPISVGYQRRFDPHMQRLQRLIHEEHALLPATPVAGLTPCPGGLEKMVSTSKDPDYPALEKMDGLNGFQDSVVHDVDSICHLARQFPWRVFSAAHAHFAAVARRKDFDRVFVTLEFASGLLALVDWCRRSGFAYDQRLSVQGYGGALEVGNDRDSLVVRHTQSGALMAPPKNYFAQRYEEAYANEMDHFVEVVRGKKSVSTTHEQVRNVNIIVCCAEQSARSGKPVDIRYQDTSHT